MTEHGKNVDIDALSQAVLDLGKNEVSEVRSFLNPPIGVQKAVCAVTLLMGYCNTTNEIENWKVAKKFLSKTELQKNMDEFDLEKVKPETVTKAKKMLEVLDDETMKKNNLAAYTFYNWAMGVIEEIEAKSKK